MRGPLPALLAGIMTVLTLFALTGYQVTGATSATRMLGRLGAALIEIDRWVPAHIENLDLLARDQPQGGVTVEDLPMAVTLPSSRLIAAQPAELTFLLREEMGRSLYRNGTDAFRTAQGRPADLGVTEPVRWAVNLLDEDMHGRWQIGLVVTTLLLLLFCGICIAGGNSPLPAVAIGAAVATGLALAGWAAFQAASSSFESTIDQEIMLMARDGAWIGVRNSAAVAVAAGLLLLLLRFVLDHGRRSGYAEPSQHPGHY